MFQPLPATNRTRSFALACARTTWSQRYGTGITLVPDEMTLAAKGQLKITAVMLSRGQKLIRKAGGFYKAADRRQLRGRHDT